MRLALRLHPGSLQQVLRAVLAVQDLEDGALVAGQDVEEGFGRDTEFALHEAAFAHHTLGHVLDRFGWETEFRGVPADDPVRVGEQCAVDPEACTVVSALAHG